MATRKSKPASFDAMVKLFMKQHQIPSKKDVDKLLAKIERLENLLKESAASTQRSGKSILPTSPKTKMTATETVMQVIKESEEPISFSQIKEKTGFGEKKLRNIIFRMGKMGKILTVSRGVYTAA